MIIGRKNLEKRIDEIGRQTLNICYGCLTNLDDIACTSYTPIMTAGYRALNHRKQRILKWYDLHKPLIMTEYCVHNVETYVMKMMSKEANKLLFLPIRNPYEKKYRILSWINGICKRHD